MQQQQQQQVNMNRPSVNNVMSNQPVSKTNTVPVIVPPMIVQPTATKTQQPSSATVPPPQVVNIANFTTNPVVEIPIVNIGHSTQAPIQNKHLMPSGNVVNPYSTPTKTPGKEELFALNSVAEILPPVLPSTSTNQNTTVNANNNSLTSSKSLENIVENKKPMETVKVIPPAIKLPQQNTSSSSVERLNKSPPITITAEPIVVNPNLKNLKPGICKHKCQIPNCVCYCAFDHSSQEYKDFIEAENGGLDFHMCSNSHPCQQFCSHRGFCEIKAEAKYTDVGLKHNCSKMLEPFKFSHSGKCLCYNDEDTKTAPRKHFCAKKCPACLSICRKEYGHDKNSFWIAKKSVDPKMKNINFETLSVKEKENLLLHDTEHAFMINTVFVTDSKLLKNNAIEIPYIHQNQERLLRFFPGQNGAKFTCESYCRVLGRGHTYLTVCSHKHGKKTSTANSLNSSSSDLKATMESSSEKQRSQSLIPKSPSQSEMSSLTPKNSEWSTANRIQFTTFTPTFNTKPATENVPRSRSVGSSLSDMAHPPELPSLTIEPTPGLETSSNTNSSNTSTTSTGSNTTLNSSGGIISGGIGGVPRRSPSNTNIAGSGPLDGSFIISSGIGGVPKRSTSSTNVNDTPTGLIHGGGVPKTSSSGSVSDLKGKSTSPSTHNTNPSTMGSSIGFGTSLTVGGGSQIIVSPRGVPVSPRYGREDSMIITDNFDDSLSDNGEEDCPYNGELSLMATGRKHSTMKCEPMDELKHEKFWSLCGFVDPCKKACMSNEEMRQFNLCRVQKLDQNSTSNTPLEYCKRHVSHQVLDCSALDYLEEVSLLAERFPAKENGFIFSPSGHLFKATPNTGIHHYIFVDVSRNMSSQDMIPSLPVFKPAGKSLKQSEKGEDYSQFTAYDNRLGSAIEIVLRYLHILFKLRPADRMTVGIFTKKSVEIIIDNEDLEYYYSVIDLITNKIKKPDNDGGYEEVFTLLVDLLAKHDPKQSKDPINRNMRPKIYLVTANQIESKFSAPNFGKTASSSTGTPVWHSLGKLESLSLQRKKKKEQTKLDDIVEWYESNGISANSTGSASEPEPYISIIKMGSEGNESTLNQILLKCKGLSTIVDSTFVSVNVNNKLTEEEKEIIKKKSGKEPALMQRLVICHMLQDLLLTHLEHNKIRLNENMRISGASSASSGKCGLLIKSVIDQMQHADSDSDSDYDSDEELSNIGFGSFMIGKKSHKGSPVDVLEDLETVTTETSPNIESNKTSDNSATETKTSTEKQEDVKQLENEKDILERENLAKEILDTERAYVTSMAKIIELYYYPLLKYLPNLISEDDKSKIFGGLLGIYKLHKILVTDLEERVNEWHKDQKIADIFIKLHQTFKLYTTFSTKYEMAIETYSKHKDNPRFRNYLYIRRKDPFSKGEQLQGFLIKPIQRIPRYILLLKGLLKHTKNPEHPDFGNLVNAISITEEVATFLNNKIRERQYFYRMKSVADRLSGLTDLIQPQRRYICEFDKLRSTYDTHVNEECVVFLFNDLFIHAVRESENTQEEDGKLSRVRRKLSVKANSQPNITSTVNVPTPSVSASTSELGGTPSGAAAMKIATAEGANGIDKSDNVDVMGIMEEKKKDRYEARFVLSLGDLTVHPMDFGSNNSKFQISAIARKFTVEYDVMNRPNEKVRIITKLNDAITDFVKRKQSFQTISQQNSSPQH
ncbi:rhoGEF domain-containing protein [Naegleria gruberi]|uniref:RhoGEF domain-containing protein n=1 Tax=Naegleria gruberi TaxID=5762 RepID=D2W0U0_NAEGR|nr:rhoGEF domain-containing protein [Naegleria gruberi]EFC37397.1 rhoGEF domain-containing protein [Naegleria gruberi]|eukprot:XP_002670141.1 rhoGEF domain-containing protein [Naegleria gruberi strain NEG-M]